MRDSTKKRDKFIQSFAFTLVISGVLAYYFGTYTFDNPDSFGTKKYHTGCFVAPYSDLASPFALNSSWTDVSPKFKLFFECGFILNCVCILYSLMALV